MDRLREAAKTTLYYDTAEAVAQQLGLYYDTSAEVKSSPLAANAELAKAL